MNHIAGNIPDLIRNLKDAGCDAPTIKKFFLLQESGKTGEQLRLLTQQKTVLLEKFHDSRKRIDCLDHLIFVVKQQSKQNRGV